MFAKLLFNKQHAKIGRNLLMCVTATAIALPLVAKDYKLTHCDQANKVEEIATPTALTSAESNVINPLDNSGVDAAIEQLAGNSETIEVVIDEENDAAWVEEKSHCSFCKMFILSPCKKQFKYWSTCADLARTENKDLPTGCAKYFEALMECTSEHTDYFKQLEEMEREKESEEESAEASADGESGTTDDLVSHTETREVAVHGVRLDSEEDEK